MLRGTDVGGTGRVVVRDRACGLGDGDGDGGVGRLTKNVSFGSAVVSPLTLMVIVCDVLFGGKVTVLRRPRNRRRQRSQCHSGTETAPKPRRPTRSSLPELSLRLARLSVPPFGMCGPMRLYPPPDQKGASVQVTRRAKDSRAGAEMTSPTPRHATGHRATRPRWHPDDCARELPSRAPVSHPMVCAPLR